MAEDDWLDMEADGFIGLVGPIQHKPFRGDGRGHFRFFAADKHRNRNGVVQGGMLMTFADRGLGYTTRQNDMDRTQATVQLDMHFIRPAPLGSTVELVAHVVRETRSMVFVDGVLTVDGETVATARGMWKIIRR